MVMVIFRSRLREPIAAGYAERAARLLDLARETPGFVLGPDVSARAGRVSDVSRAMSGQRWIGGEVAGKGRVCGWEAG